MRIDTLFLHLHINHCALNVVGNNKTHLGIQVKCPIIWDFNQIWIYWQIFIKFPDIKFQENNPEWDTLIHADRTAGGWTDSYDTPKGAFRDYMNAPKNSISTWQVAMYLTTEIYPWMFFSKIKAGLLCDSHHVYEYTGC